MQSRSLPAIAGVFLSAGARALARRFRSPARSARAPRARSPAHVTGARAAHGISAAELRKRIEARSARIGVLGLGSVGLPLARTFVAAGFPVTGFDVDREKIARLTAGETTLHHLAPDLVGSLLAAERFALTGDPRRQADLDVALIAVPTPLDADRRPDLGCVLAAAESLAVSLAPGALVVLESTTYPGTTRREIGAVFARHGFTPGVDLWLAHSPEREDPGRRDVGTAAIAKLVGGVDATSGDLAEQLYAAAFEQIVRVSSTEIAEAAKLHENTYRAVNIALANEMKVVCAALGLDVWEVIEAAATKPFGFQKFAPGPGTGGACVPVDPHYLAWIARENGVATPLVNVALEVNGAMPAFVVERTRAALAQRGVGLGGARVLVLGLAYKRDVDVVNGSPAIRVIELLEAQGARVEYSDPHVARAPVDAGPHVHGRRSTELDEATIAAFDALVVATDHAAFDWERIAEHARLVVDTRNALATRMTGRASYVRA